MNIYKKVRIALLVLGLISLAAFPTMSAWKTRFQIVQEYNTTGLAPTLSTALTNTVSTGLTLTHETTGTAANGIGVGINFVQDVAAAGSTNDEIGARIVAVTTDVTGASEDFDLVFYGMAGGATATERLRLSSLEAAVNDVSADVNFRVESDGNADAIFVDAGTDRVGIFTAAPTVAFDVTGASLFTGDMTVEGAVVINDTSADVNFRVESDGNADAIFVDAGTDRVGIFTGAPTVPLEVTGVSLFTGAMTIEGAVIINDTSADVDTRIESLNDPAAIFVDAGNDWVGIFNGTPTRPLDVLGESLLTGTMTLAGAFAQDGGDVIVNDDSADIDFTVESDDVADALSLNGGTDQLTIGAGLIYPPSNVNAATYNVLSTDKILYVSYTATGTVAITLPTLGCVQGRFLHVQDAGNNANTFNITIDTEGVETINGGATVVMSTDSGGLNVYCDGTNWHAW